MSHNSFGHLFRITTWGESHGPAIGCVVDGCPPGIPITEAEIQAFLDKRKPGQSKYTTQRKEPDQVRILSGVFTDEGGAQLTTGTPISLEIANVDARSKDYGEIKDKFRPGHADYTYQMKYGLRDWRGSGRASARETACRVAAGAIARKVVPGLRVRGALTQIGPYEIDRRNWNWDEIGNNPFFCPDAKTARVWADFLDQVRKKGSSAGAIIEVIAEGTPPGLGAPLYAKLDQDIASALMSINAVKGVEIGAGFASAALSGRGKCRRDAHDEGRHARVPVEQCRRHSRRHLDGPADRRALRGQAHLIDPDAAADGRYIRPRHRDLDQRPPRSLRRHSRGADRRGDGGHRAGRPLPPPSRPDRQGVMIFRSIVVLTGAGLSAESGLGTFRDKGGLWEEFDLEEVATPEGFARNPARVHEFYNLRRRRLGDARPNAAHHALARLEKEHAGRVLTVTQNIDGLHEAAGTHALIHMHGELARALCAACLASYPWTEDLSTETVCAACGQAGALRPDVVWFGEMPREMDRIYQALVACDLFVSIGTSGSVYPAAGFVAEARAAGAHTVELNLEPSEGASLFAEALYGPATEIVPGFVDRLLRG